MKGNKRRTPEGYYNAPGAYPQVRRGYGAPMAPPGACGPAPPPGRVVEPTFRDRAGLSGWSVLLLIPLIALLAIFLVLVLVGRPYIVHGSSMYPTLNDGDRVFVVPYRGNTSVDRGDVVVLKGVGNTDEMLIKRAVALPGDKVTIGDGKVIVNDRYVHRNTNRTSNQPQSQLVPDRMLFVMGDNEGHSYDSRTFGPIPENRVVGKAMFIFWPPGDFKKL